MDGGRIVIANAEYIHAQLRHIHAQNADDISRSAPAGNKNSSGVNNRVYQLVDLLLIDSSQNLRVDFAHFLSSFQLIHFQISFSFGAKP